MTAVLLVLVGAGTSSQSAFLKTSGKYNSQVGLGSADQSCELTLVLALDILESDDSGSLLVDDGTETGLALDDHVGYTHLSAESREEDNKLNGIDIVSNDNE